jgi:hypothetical protein
MGSESRLKDVMSFRLTEMERTAIKEACAVSGEITPSDFVRRAALGVALGVPSCHCGHFLNFHIAYGYGACLLCGCTKGEAR